MDNVKKQTKSNATEEAKGKSPAKNKKPGGDRIEDIQKLVHLLQVHQIELEHQNQELRIAHQELEVSRSKYVNLYDFSPIPYFTLDPDGIIKEVNLNAGKMLGVDRSKLIGRRFVSYIPLEEKNVFYSFIQAVFKSQVKHSCDLKMESKDKKLFNVLLEGLVVNDLLESEQRCQVALIDLTEYKKVEGSLRESTEKLKLLNATKDKIFSIIAHDLRSPFQSLLSSSELLAADIEKLSHEEVKIFSRGLNDNLNNLYGLLDNLLHWSLMQRNMLDFKPVNFKLYDVVNKITGISNHNAVRKKITIVNNVYHGNFVYADVDTIHSVIQNLISNAIKFTPAEGKVIVSSAAREGFIDVSVEDTGIGIEPEKIAKMFNFNSFFTTHGTAGEKGTGLGLPLCKEFVERNDGKIWVESELGKGSKFTFCLRKSQF